MGELVVAFFRVVSGVIMPDQWAVYFVGAVSGGRGYLVRGSVLLSWCYGWFVWILSER